MAINIILILIIIVSVAAVAARNLFSALVSLALAGSGLLLIFLILKAPLLAIVQLAAGAAYILFLMRTTANKDEEYAKVKPNLFNIITGVLFTAGFLFFIYAALKELPSGNLPPALKDPGAGFNILIEIAVLSLAVIGILALMRKND